MMRAMPGHVSANRRITVAFQLGARDRKWSTTAGRGTSRECPVWDTHLPDFRDNLAGSFRPLCKALHKGRYAKFAIM